jgi:hypothetical protein
MEFLRTTGSVGDTSTRSVSLLLPKAPSQICNSQLRKEMVVGAVGVEPTTNGLKGRCSATELRP